MEESLIHILSEKSKSEKTIYYMIPIYRHSGKDKNKKISGCQQLVGRKE